MSRLPCIAQVGRTLAELGIEGIADATIGRLVDGAFADAAVRNITDPVAREEFVADQVLQKVVAGLTAKRDAKVEQTRRVTEIALDLSRRKQEGQSLFRHLKGLLVGSLKGRDSVGLAQFTTLQQSLGELQLALEEAGLFHRFLNADEDLTREILSRRTDISPEAAKIRSIIEEMETRRLVRMKMAGLDVAPLPNRIFRQHHDPYLMANARKHVDGNFVSDRDAWVYFVGTRLDPKTFEGLGPEVSRIQVLEEMYDNFVVGRNNVITDAPFSEVPVQDALTASRKLHFTPEGEFEYMRTFGAGSLAESIFKEISSYSQHMGLVQILGPRPHQTLREVIHALRTYHPGDKDLEAYIRGFDAGQMNSRLGKDWSEVSGRNDMVVGTKMHEVSSWLQVFEFVTKLGKSMLAAGMDVPGMAAEFNFQTGNPIGSLARGIGAVLEGISAPADQRRVADALGVGMEGMMNEHYMRLGGSISPSGRRAEILSFTFKWNLLGPWTNTVRRGFYISMSKYMASGIQEKAFTPRMMALLETYGIEKEHLRTIRKNLDFSTESGIDMFDPTRIAQIPSLEFGPGLEGLQTRELIQRRLTGFMLDRMNFGVFTPDADTRSIVHQGLPKGEPLRVLLDLFFQFKQYGIGFVRGPIANSLMGPGQTTKSGLMTLGAHLSFLLPFGAAINHLKDFAKGREQFYPTNREESLKYFTNAFIQSGAIGIYGDFLFSGADSLPELAMRMAGPVANDAVDYAEVLESMASGDGQTGAKLFRAARNDIPLADIFYIQTPLDYAMMYGLAEQMDPGFARKYEKMIKSQRMGRGLILPPSEYAIGVD